jgi:leucine-zipper of insertion element IS481
MSRQDLQRVEVLTEVLADRRTTVSAAGVLGVSLRQAQRLLARYRAGGGGAMIHRSRGRPASNRLGPGVQEYLFPGPDLKASKDFVDYATACTITGTNDLLADPFGTKLYWVKF